MRRSLLILFLLAAAPGHAAPRYSARLENVSVSDVVRQLESFYGVPISLAGVPESRVTAAQEPRASFDWHSATFGQVVKDVERAFRLQAVRTPSSSIRFSPGVATRSELAADAGSVTVVLREVRQTETRRKVVGAGTTETERSLRLTLLIRPKEGDPDLVRGIGELSLADEHPSRRETAPGPFPLALTADFPTRPEERIVVVELPASQAGASGRLAVEGQVLLRRAVRNYRVELTGPNRRLAPQAESPVQIVELPVEGAPVNSVTFRVSWPATLHVSLGTPEAPAGIRCFHRSSEGAVLPVTLSGVRIHPQADGSGLAQVTATLPPGAGEAGALVWDVTAFEPQELRMPFRFSRVELPLDAPTPALQPTPRKRQP